MKISGTTRRQFLLAFLGASVASKLAICRPGFADDRVRSTEREIIEKIAEHYSGIEKRDLKYENVVRDFTRLVHDNDTDQSKCVDTVQAWIDDDFKNHRIFEFEEWIITDTEGQLAVHLSRGL